MNAQRITPLLVLGLLGAVAQHPVFAADPPVTWKEAQRQEANWYGSAEAVRIADNLLVYQHDNGGWSKNIDMSKPLSESERAKLVKEKTNTKETTIDNGATHQQVAFLGKVYTASKQERFKEPFLKGLDYLMDAQYDNGGWPQYFPLRKGYYTHITFNDDAMAGVLTLLRSVARAESDYAFVDNTRRERATKAVVKGVDCILKCQVITEGKRTGWGQQHDEKTFAPAPARAFELVSLTAGETVGIVRFLMGEKPTPEIVSAIEGGINWLRTTRINGIRVETKSVSGEPGGKDKVVVEDPTAPPLWARFYQIGTNRPFFCGRDGVMKFRLADIEHERRNGYAWYVSTPGKLLDTDYPAWQKKALKTATRP
jgi:PelA/Pel-15E family pectate lyase